MTTKTISFFWGNEKMSWLRYMTLYSFRKYNPVWTINLYLSEQKITHKTWKTPEYQDFFVYKGQDYFTLLNDLNVNIKSYNVLTKDNQEISPSQKSNFFKWNLLATEGGFYGDMDILFVRSIDDMYNKTKEFDTGITFTQYYSIGFMFSNGNNAFFQSVYDKCFRDFNVHDYQGAGVHQLAEYPNINVIEQKHGKVYNIPFTYLYQYDSLHIDQIHNGGDYKMNEENIGLHWYAGHIMSQSANNTLTKDSYINYNNLLCRTLREILND